MPHRDPETGQFLPGEGPAGDVDYSEFEYEHHSLQATLADPTGSGTATAEYTVDPLEDFGGLESDELAEVVAMFWTASLFFHQRDTSATTTPKQATASVVHGVNLEESEVPLESAVADVGELDTNAPAFDADSADSILELKAVTEPGVFYHQTIQGDPAAIDDASGWATSAFGQMASGSRMYRAMVGRGPVIDPTDSLDWWIRVNIANSNVEPAIHISQTTVYDTAEFTGKRARFSLP